jgi:LruC domain-containing protein
MRIFKQTKLLLVLLVGIFFSSCLNEKYKDLEPTGFAGFEFKTTKNIEVNIQTLNNANQAMGGVYMSVYSVNPLNEDGTLIDNAADFLIHKGATTNNGKLEFVAAVPTYVDSVAVLLSYIGLPNLHMQKIIGSKLNFTIGGAPKASSSAQKALQAPLSLPTPTKVSGFYVLGTWNSSGFPNYLSLPNDVITKEFLADVNATLPENIKIQDSHPEYLQSKDEGSIVLVEDAEVWVTFVHEGAGYKNTLGYYTHPNDNPPANKEGIRDATIIFPNVSYSGSGGMLASGNKVQLLYLDPVTNLYTKRFPAGTTVAWWFRSHGFGTGTSTSLSAGYNTFYSDARFNPEKNEELRKHNILVKDDARKLLLIGFEDIHREQRPDDDFNDAVFYATVSPYTAIKSDIYQKIDTPRDTDGDGVSDTMDDYPNDPNKAYDNFYPTKSSFGTLAFEDLWPSKGDYDFNDLVVDYNMNQITNAQNQIVEISAHFKLRAVGASFRNAFAIELNMPASNVKAVNGQLLSKSIFDIAANGTERNQTKAVVVIFDDPVAAFAIPNQNSLINTVKGSTVFQPKSINIKIELNNPISLTQLGTPPYNPFIVVNAERGREVHLPGSTPTDLADRKLFGTVHDNSNPATGKYYMSDKYLPWAINIPISFDYPAEKQEVNKAYLMFDAWANSRGFNYMDWYMPKAGYRNNEKIFNAK